jgi:hypothetical protein
MGRQDVMAHDAEYPRLLWKRFDKSLPKILNRHTVLEALLQYADIPSTNP